MPDITESDQIAGVYVVEPTIHGDQRGLFIETYRREWIPGARELGVAWNDPAIAADWGVTEPILSERDQQNPLRADLPANRRPYWPMRT